MRTNNNPGTPQETSRAANAERLAAPTGLLSAHSPSGTVANADNTQQRQVGDLPPAGAYDSRAVTSALIPVEDKQGTASMIRLTQSMKIVKVPIAGQPGRYLTGLLPVIPATAQPTASEAPKVDPVLQQEGTLTPSQGPVKTIVLLVLVLLIVFGSGIFLLMFSHNRQPATDNTIKTATTPVAALTAAAQASATVSANIILTDPLSSNDHNWKVFNKGPQQFVFKDGAYSISNNDTHAATALLPDETLPSSFIYTLTLNEIKGDDTSVNNQFGLVIRYTERKKDGRLTSTFYLFDIASAKSGGEYQFWKYDDSFKNDVNPWTKLWNKPYGKEYHFGHGPNQINTFKIMVQGSKYSFVVNDKPLGSTSDNALNGGQIGMLVNQKGTEVAFSNLLLTYQ